MSAKTLADIARLAGVSRTTASYVINGKAEHHRISEQTVARVMEVVEANDFQVDARAAALRRGSTQTLGLIVPDLENNSYARLAKLIERGVRSAGYHVLIACSDDDPETERQLARRLRAQRCDALIVASCLPVGDVFYSEMLQAGVPIIGLDRPMDSQRFCWVASDNQSAARILTESVLNGEPGHLLWLEAITRLSVTHARRTGFDAAAAAFAPAARAHHASGARYDRATGRTLMSTHLAEHGLPDVIISAAYPLLDGALDVLLDESGRAPNHMPRIATFGDDRLLDFLPMAINSMAQQHDQVAERLVKRVLDALDGRYTPGHDDVPRLIKTRLRPQHTV